MLDALARSLLNITHRIPAQAGAYGCGDSGFGTVFPSAALTLFGNDPFSTSHRSPAKAGVQVGQRRLAWTPAFAGEQFLICLKDICANLFQSLPRTRSEGPWSPLA